MPLPRWLLVGMEGVNSCVNCAGWILQTCSNTVILIDTRVTTFVMTRDGIRHCQFCSILDAMTRVGASVARLGGKRKILAPVGTVLGPTISRPNVKRALTYSIVSVSSGVHNSRLHRVLISA
jgi:hypothetical protein